MEQKPSILFEDLPGTRRYRRRAGSTNRAVPNEGQKLPKLRKFMDAAEYNDVVEVNYNFMS